MLIDVGRTENVVGDRVLVAVQAVNISRLSTHPVPTVPGTLIVVAGAGPKDSNGAGKSSFIAAITALLGDEQWRFASGAKAVGELLFNAELAAHGATQWASAAHGYIAGVFASPGSMDDAMTVWLRVNQDAPHLEIRWTDGVRLAAAPSEAERVSRADDVWASLPRSAGRRDVVARDLSRVLYGERVRCVSFLSTSVRSKVATNLLSQPLNEIAPERIFEAIAALTGLDAELEQEREARRDEHARRVAAEQAAERLAEFETEAGSLLASFERRDRARDRLEQARRCWRSRQARLLLAAAERDEALAAELVRLREAAAEAAGAIEAVRAEIATLRDDTMDREVAAARQALAAAQARSNRLDAERAVAENTADELRGRIAALEDAVRYADGRDLDAATREVAAAKAALGEALKAQGVADKEAADAAREREAAENGPRAAAPQLDALTAAGVPAAALLDALDLAEEARERFAAPDWPAGSAVVVSAGDMARASAALDGLPGSVLISPAGVTVVGEFEAAVTGREARVKAAEQRLNRARDAVQRAAEDVAAAEEAVALAERRLEGARAARELVTVRERVAEVRERLTELAETAETLAPAVLAAEERVAALDFRARTRNVEIEKLEARRARHERDRDEARTRAGEVAAARADLGLDRLAEDFGAPVEAAREWVLALTEAERPLTADEWWRTAERHLDDALRGVFPAGPDDEDMPEELAFLVRERNTPGAGRTARELASFERVTAALGAYLRQQEEYEAHQRRQIETQLASRRADLNAASTGAAEAARSTAVHRAQLTDAIRARLTRVAEEFGKLDLAYGGYGATLEFPTPPPPADPEHRWSWKVVPKWRRSEGQGFVPYNRRANTALMDEKAVKLVCAAAIASSGGGHLCLVLDELGRNLGKEHRREAVALFRRIGETYGITVIGALQDDMEPYAIDACGQYVKLRRSSDAMPYNEPPIVVGYDEHAERVRALSAFVTEGRE
ncbi:chromosome partitioning protein ParA [Bailinhaonella thermotolerans]|uniref:Chromosome partitioning protein ParA n=1 Tax=Bailinhaonella thermotolerans TaxID=1070861 RepID=A0A3A4B8V2_9ACTN|nr:chromosome partitioning protein ParA [Bailinhaonella thermotolerans]RJL34114.1 chromosome partitioning protein ParA [Bailinhaonella thermotolerans]